MGVRSTVPTAVLASQLSWLSKSSPLVAAATWVDGNQFHPCVWTTVLWALESVFEFPPAIHGSSQSGQEEAWHCHTQLNTTKESQLRKNPNLQQQAEPGKQKRKGTAWIKWSLKLTGPAHSPLYLELLGTEFLLFSHTGGGTQALGMLGRHSANEPLP